MRKSKAYETQRHCLSSSGVINFSFKNLVRPSFRKPRFAFRNMISPAFSFLFGYSLVDSFSAEEAEITNTSWSCLTIRCTSALGDSVRNRLAIWSLSNHDDDGNENVTNLNIFKAMIVLHALQVQFSFLTFRRRSRSFYDVKWPVLHMFVCEHMMTNAQFFLVISKALVVI